MPVDNCLIILIGGEGAVAGRDNCGSLCPSEKAKIEKIGVGAGSSELVIR